MNRAIFGATLALIVPWVLFAQINWTEHIITDSFTSPHSIYAIDLDGDNDIDVLGAAASADAFIWWQTKAPVGGSYGDDAIFVGNVKNPFNVGTAGNPAQTIDDVDTGTLNPGAGISVYVYGDSTGSYVISGYGKKGKLNLELPRVLQTKMKKSCLAPGFSSDPQTSSQVLGIKEKKWKII